MTRVRFALLLGLALGCAEPPEAPPAEGEPCDIDADCRSRRDDAAVPGCGFRPLCIAGRCELSASAPDLSRCDEPWDAALDRDE